MNNLLGGKDAGGSARLETAHPNTSSLHLHIAESSRFIKLSPFLGGIEANPAANFALDGAAYLWRRGRAVDELVFEHAP